jgi:hypothetical protein
LMVKTKATVEPNTNGPMGSSHLAGIRDRIWSARHMKV